MAEAVACNGSGCHRPGCGGAWRESGRRRGCGQEEKHGWPPQLSFYVTDIARMNPLPHLASADSFLYLPTRRSMKIQAAAVADYAARLHAEPCWALLFFFVALMCTGSLLREEFSMPLFERKDMEKRIFREVRHGMA